MQIEKAMENAEELPEIKSIIKEGGFLCSGYVILECKDEIKEWNLSYYNPKTKKMTQVKITNGGHEVSQPDDPLREKEYSTFQAKIKISGEKAIEIAEKHLESTSCIKVILSLQKEDGREFWSVAFMSSLGQVKSVRIDVEDGKVLDSETTDLIRRKSFAS